MVNYAEESDGFGALLPAGLSDGLPPAATHEAELIEHFIAAFSRRGYDRVKPPLVEFEETLLAGTGSRVANQTFRLMDPVSQRMMGVRADITPQVARLALSRLSRAMRPLRLTYAGQVLRVRGTQLRPERQFGQVGAEIIGSNSVRAEAEVIVMSAEAMIAAGVPDLTVDIAHPDLARLICEALDVEQAGLREALDRKDGAAVAKAAGEHAALFSQLLRAAGPAEGCLVALRALGLPDAAQRELDHLSELVAAIRESVPQFAVTIDPVERRGFEYQSGACFTFFARGVRGELGRGGRYHCSGGLEPGEPAVGATLYLDSLLRAVPRRQPADKLYLPFGTTVAEGAALREEGWATVSALEEESDADEAAARLGCNYILRDGKAQELKR